MTPRQITLFLLIAGSSWGWGADNKENLEQARSQYRQAVSAHGARSPEAKNARQNLRASRRSFHAQRREQMRNRSRSR